MPSAHSVPATCVRSAQSLERVSRQLGLAAAGGRLDQLG